MEIECANELKSKAYTEEPVKRMTGCPASAFIFHFTKLCTHGARTLKIHPDAGFLDTPKFRHSFLREVIRTLNVIASLFLNVKTIYTGRFMCNMGIGFQVQNHLAFTGVCHTEQFCLSAPARVLREPVMHRMAQITSSKTTPQMVFFYRMVGMFFSMIPCSYCSCRILSEHHFTNTSNLFSLPQNTKTVKTIF